MQPVGFLQPRLELVLHRQRHLQRERRYGLDQHAPDGLIEPAAGHALTDRLRAGDATLLTHIGGPQGAMTLAIAHSHPIAALTAYDHPLQQRRSLPPRAPPS